MKFLNKTFLLTLLSCSIFKSWAVPTEEFINKTKFLLNTYCCKVPVRLYFHNYWILNGCTQKIDILFKTKLRYNIIDIAHK